MRHSHVTGVPVSTMDQTVSSPKSIGHCLPVANDSRKAMPAAPAYYLHAPEVPVPSEPLDRRQFLAHPLVWSKGLKGNGTTDGPFGMNCGDQQGYRWLCVEPLPDLRFTILRGFSSQKHRDSLLRAV